MDKILPLYRSHYSLGSSILTLDKPQGIDIYPTSIFDLVLASKKDYLCLVENNMTGFLEAVKNCNDNKIKLIFGLRIEVTRDIKNQDEESLKHRAKYIILAKNNAGYQSLIKLWSCAAKEGFYYNACLDFANIKKLWNDNLILGVPFYDSFLHVNAFYGHTHVPELDFTKPIFFIEENSLPFDAHLRNKVIDYCQKNSYNTIEAQSIYYKSKLDFIAYMTFRCISNRTTIEKPELDHMGSDTFNYEGWLKNNERI